MRLIPNSQNFWSCQKTGNSNFLIPFGLVTSSDPTDNMLHILWYGTFTINSIDVVDLDGNIVANINPSLIVSTTASYNGVNKTVKMLRVPVSVIAPFTMCFYIRFNGTGYSFKTEGYKIFKFDECQDDLIRVESSYPTFDTVYHNIETGLGLPVENLPNYYPMFVSGEKYRNFQWFYGGLAWGESKITKTLEGYYNTHTKTAMSENYDLFLRPMPDWYAKELTNCLGGASLEIYSNDTKLTHDFECIEMSLQQDKKSCLVLSSGIKLNSQNKNIYVGCV